jgi:hypothetical protein
MTVAIIDNRGLRPVIVGAGAQVAGALVAEAASKLALAQAALAAAEDAQAAAEIARDAAVAGASSEGYRPTIAAAITDFTVGQYFTSDDQGEVTAHPNELRLYLRTGTSPFYADQGDEASPLGRTLLDAELTRRRRVINVDDPEYGAVGNCVPLGPGLTTGTDDTAAFNAAIDALWDDWNKFVQYEATTRPDLNQFAIRGPVLTGGDGKLYRISGDLRSPPPGTTIDLGNCVIVADAHNIDILSLLRPESGGVVLPDVGGGTSEGYGTSHVTYLGLNIHCNGYGGTFWRIDTADNIGFFPVNIFGAGESPNLLSGALVNGSRFVGVSPTDFAKVKIGDVYNLAGELDWLGNPRTYLVVDMLVEDDEATDRTYGALKLDQTWTGATGNADCQQLSVVHVTMKLQQSYWVGRSNFKNCPWSFYHGRNRDEITSGSNGWRNETVVTAFGLNDCEVGEYFEEGCDYGGVFGPWGINFRVEKQRSQFNRLGSHLFINCIEYHSLGTATEQDTGQSSELNAIPGIVVYPGVRFLFDDCEFATGGQARKAVAFSSNSFGVLKTWKTGGSVIPEFADGTHALFVRQSATGTLMLMDARNTGGPDANYEFEPRRWCSLPNGADAGFGYTGVQTGLRGQQVYTTGTAFSIFSSQPDASARLFELGSYASGEDENAVKFAVDGNGNVYISGYLTADLLKVLGPRVQGFTQMTGTASKGALATYDAPTISGTYSQSEVQALANAVQALSRRLKAHEDAMFNHGQIGA